MFAAKRLYLSSMKTFIFAVWRKIVVEPTVFVPIVGVHLVYTRAAHNFWSHRAFHYSMSCEVQTSIRKDYADFVTEKQVLAQKAADGNDSKTLFSIARTLGGKRRPDAGTIILDSGQPASNHDESQLCWLNYFARQLAARVGDEKNLVHTPGFLPDGDRFRRLGWSPQTFIDAILVAPSGRATGLDVIPNELLKVNPEAVAKHIFSIAHSAVSIGAPLAWKGGLMVDIFKGSGDRELVTNSRGVLTSSNVGKIYAKAVRRQLLPYLQAVVGDEQYGGLPGRGAVYGSHVIRQFFQHSRRRKISAAVIFVDAVAAFYSVLRPLLVGFSGSDVELVTFLHRVGIPPEALAELVIFIRDFNSVLAQARVPEDLAALITDWHVGDWFTVDFCNSTASPEGGTRPGDPLADILFNFAMCYLLKQLRAELQAISPCVAVSVNLEQGPFMGSALPRSEFSPRDISYMDDLAAMLLHLDAVTLVADVSRSALIIQRVFNRWGMKLNFKPNKSEVMVALRGPSAKRAAQSIERLDGQPVLTVNDHTSLRVIRKYRHLGTVCTATGAYGPEISHRVSSTATAYQPLAHKLFSAKHIDRAVRLSLASSLLWTRLTYGAGSWDPLPKGLLQRLEAARLRTFRKILGVYRAHDRGVSDNDVLRQLKQPPILHVLRVERLLYGARLARDKPRLLLALLQEGTPSNSPWSKVFLDDVQAMREAFPSKLGSLPDPAVSPHEWAEFFTNFYGPWKTLVKSLPIVYDADPDSHVPVTTINCYICHKPYKVKGLGAHMFRAHGIRMEARRFCPHSRCLSCGKDFHDRHRCLHHLAFSSKICLENIMASGVAPLDDISIKALAKHDTALRRSAKLAGLSYLAGGRPVSSP